MSKSKQGDTARLNVAKAIKDKLKKEKEARKSCCGTRGKLFALGFAMEIFPLVNLYSLNNQNSFYGTLEEYKRQQRIIVAMSVCGFGIAMGSLLYRPRGTIESMSEFFESSYNKISGFLGGIYSACVSSKNSLTEKVGGLFAVKDEHKKEKKQEDVCKKTELVKEKAEEQSRKNAEEEEKIRIQNDREAAAKAAKEQEEVASLQNRVENINDHIVQVEGRLLEVEESAGKFALEVQGVVGANNGFESKIRNVEGAMELCENALMQADEVINEIVASIAQEIKWRISSAEKEFLYADRKILESKIKLAETDLELLEIDMKIAILETSRIEMLLRERTEHIIEAERHLDICCSVKSMRDIFVGDVGENVSMDGKKITLTFSTKGQKDGEGVKICDVEVDNPELLLSQAESHIKALQNGKDAAYVNEVLSRRTGGEVAVNL